MKKVQYLLMAVLCVMTLYRCKETGRIDFIDDSSVVPAQITDVKIKSTPGGALITYKLPDDPTLSCVKAVYEIQPNVFREAKSSRYMDTLEIVGFGDTLKHEVKLFSVGLNQKESAPIVASVKPLLPAIKTVFGSLTLAPTFSGVRVTFENESQAKLALVLLSDSTGKGDWSPVTTFHTAAEKGAFSMRGFKSTERTFALFVRDRWNNKSDTLIKVLKPLYEEPISKNTWSPVFLPTDTYQYVETFDLTKMWDGSFGYNIFASKHTSPLPQWFTIDLGKKVTLSRMKEFQYHESPYSGSCVKSFEIWGSNNPNPNGSWDNWTLLGTFNSFKPSGLPAGSYNSDDVSYAISQGEDFEFPEGIPAVRYIRFKTVETFANKTMGQVVIVELNFWGQQE
ncbi:MAG: DUF5126 domain-containing protein [Prolixibacteraceae bacterium]|nr:DUF5126 domain-containing protein [Prolixibacteraceae bacterium]